MEISSLEVLYSVMGVEAPDPGVANPDPGVPTPDPGVTPSDVGDPLWFVVFFFNPEGVELILMNVLRFWMMGGDLGVDWRRVRVGGTAL